MAEGRLNVYALLRAIAGLALRWFYRDIAVEGADRIPRRQPLLLVVNHPNALVDALLVGWIVPRRVLITAKATLFANPIASRLLRFLGVVPLRRASDEARASDAPVDPMRNRGTFDAVLAALRRAGAVLIFPEGKSHDEPALAPLKTGAARMALSARDSGSIPNLAIVPIGLTFERKDAPRTRVLVRVGEAIPLDDWAAPGGASEVDALTADIDQRLRAITANYATVDDAIRAERLAHVVAALFDDRSVADPDRGLAIEAAIARRVDVIAGRLAHADDRLRGRADAIVRRLDAVERIAAKHGIALEDIAISVAPSDAVRFVFREGWLLLVAGPLAIWGRINHWIPFRAARAVAVKPGLTGSDPAMRTVIAGTVFVLLTYLAQSLIVSALWGWRVGLAYTASLPIAAEANFYLSERLGRASRRARAFRRFRGDPTLQERLRDELLALRRDITEFDRELADARSPQASV